MPSIVDAVLQSVSDRGWEVFPLRPRSRAAYKRASESGGRRWGASRDAEEVERDFRRWPRANVGLPTGPSNSLVVLDADTPEGHDVDGLATLEEIVRRCVEQDSDAREVFDRTLTALSPTGSVHKYFQWANGRWVRTSTGLLGPGVDVRGAGGMVVMPPSRTKRGEYRWVDVSAPILPMPAWLLEALATDEERAGQAQFGGQFGSNFQPLSEAELRAAVAAIPNDESVGWHDWNNTGMAIWRASGGTELGLELFVDWSRKWTEGFDDAATRKRWRDYDSSPPDRIGAGTLIYRASQADPNWRRVVAAQEAVADAARKRSEPNVPAISESEDGVVGGDSDDDDDDENEDEDDERGVTFRDFWANLENHTFIYEPTGAMWPAASVNNYLGKLAVVDRQGRAVVDDEGTEILLNAAQWLIMHRPVHQVVWAPGHQHVIPDRHLLEGGWVSKKGETTYNTYRPPVLPPRGRERSPDRWVDHVRRLYPEEYLHIIAWCAQRVQDPGAKVNHCLVLLGSQGIGKDTLLEPLKIAVGPWNFADISPTDVLSQYNGYLQSVVVRINEARDLGDVNRYQFHERTKTMMAAPPDVLRVNEKYVAQRAVFNCCGVIITTNTKDSIYLPEDDRRHFVAYSEVVRGDYEEGYWGEMYEYYARGGARAVADFLMELDLTRGEYKFDAKAPPPQTHAFWEIVETSRSPEGSEVSTVVQAMGDPDAVTMAQVVDRCGSIPAMSSFYDWLADRRNKRSWSRVMQSAGYVPVRNPHAPSDGLWRVGGQKMVVYAKSSLGPLERIRAAERLTREEASARRDRG